MEQITRPRLERRAERAKARVRLVSRLACSRMGRRPHTLSHLVTTRCNGRCPTCLWRGRTTRELDTAAVVRLYEEAGRAGFAQLVMWGGEPLLRQDLPELLLAARRAGLLTTLITNGWHAAERRLELRGLVDALIVSVDDVGPAHDRLRGLPGLFERLQGFVAMLQADPLRPTLLLNTVLSRLNRGGLRRVAVLARDWHAGLYFCPMETGELRAGEAGDRLAELALPAAELRAAARLALALKDAGYPLLATRAYLEMLAADPELRGYTCRAPQARLTIDADGAVRDCLHVDAPLANVVDLFAGGRSLTDLFAMPAYRDMVRNAASCTKCNNADVIELSWLWDLRPAMVAKVMELAGL